MEELQKKTSCDYVTRMKFLSHDYLLDETLTKDKIDDILSQEAIKQQTRTVYKSKKSLSDFRAGLSKFLSFVHSDYHKRIENSMISEIGKIEQNTQISSTEKDALVKSRIGQGLFRKDLIEYWHGCAVSGCPLTWMLIASHIKPWRDANNQERLDAFNGLLLLPNYDKLFDLGYISFNQKGKIMCSRLLDKFDRETIGLTSDLHLIKFDERHLKYLKYHNDNCFLL